MMLKAIVIEDEYPALQRLLRQLADMQPAVQVLETIESVEEGLHKLPALKPDVIISDIELGDGLSLDLFRQVPPVCPVIFVTAFNQYAIESFKANAIDYLLKPASKEDLQAALHKVESRLTVPPIDYQKLAESMLQKEREAEKRFLLKIGTRFHALAYADVALAYTENKINYLIDNSGKRYPADLSLEQLEKELGENYFRINRSFIVRFNVITGMKQHSKGRVVLETNPPAPPEHTVVGAEKSPVFKRWLACKK